MSALRADPPGRLHGRPSSASSSSWSAAQRRIPVQYAKRVVGRKMYGGQSSHLPLEDQHRGRHPADLRLVDPDLPGDDRAVRPNSPCARTACRAACRRARLVYNLVYVGLIIFFCYFYTAVDVQPDRRRRQHEEVRRLHPRHPSGQADRRVHRSRPHAASRSAARSTSSLVCILPTSLIRQFNVPFYFGGTSLLIVVGVALDTVAQIETHLMTRNYEGFMKRGRIRGRKG